MVQGLKTVIIHHLIKWWKFVHIDCPNALAVSEDSEHYLLFNAGIYLGIGRIEHYLLFNAGIYLSIGRIGR